MRLEAKSYLFNGFDDVYLVPMLACHMLCVRSSVLTCQLVIAVVLENFIIQWTARRTRHAEKMNFLGENPFALPNAKLSFSLDRYSPHPAR